MVSPRQFDDEKLQHFLKEHAGPYHPEGVLRSFEFSLLPFLKACNGIGVPYLKFERQVGTQTVFNGHAHEVENYDNVVKVRQHV